MSTQPEQQTTAELFALAREIASACLKRQKTLSWDEAVGAAGIASAMLADIASSHGDGDRANCIEHAKKRFNEGLLVKVTKVATASGSTH